MMKKMMKYGLVVFVLLIICLLVTPFFIPKKVYIDFVTNKIEQQYPVQLGLKDASLRFLPFPQVSLFEIDVNVVGEKTSRLKAKEIHIQPNILKLLTKRVEPGFIAIKNMAVEQEKEKYVVHYLNINKLTIKEDLVASKIEGSFLLPQIKDKDVELEADLQYNIKAKKLQVAESTITIEKNQLHSKGTIDLSKENPVVDILGNTSSIGISQFSPKTKGKTVIKYSAKGSVLHLKGDVGVVSKAFSYEDETVKVKDQSLDVKVNWELVSKKLYVSKGTLQLGPQLIVFDGIYPLVDLPFNINVNIDKIQAEYLQALLKDKQSAPVLKDAGLKFSYHSSGSAKGSFSAGEVKTQTDTFSKVTTDFSYRKGKLKLTNLKAGLYKGSLTGKATIPIEDQKKQNVSFDVSLKNASLKEIKSLRKKIKGKASLHLKGNCNPLKEDWEKTLNANGNIKTSDITIEDIDILGDTFDKPVWKTISKIKQSHFNLKRLQKYLAKNRDIKNLTSKFTIKNGSFHLAKSTIKMPDSHMIIKGLYGVDGKLKLKGDLVLDKTLLKQGIQNKTILDFMTSPRNSLTLPFTITGKMPNPKISLDEKVILAHYKKAVAKLAKDKGEAVVKKGVETTLEKTKDKVIETVPKVEDKIKGLF